MSIAVSQLIGAISITGLEQSLAGMFRMGAATDDTGNKLKTLALGGVAIAGAALLGVGVASLKMAGDFQAGMTSLVTGAGEAQSNLGLVSKGILDLAVQTGTSTKQLTDGMYMIESAGFHGAAALEVLKAAAEGAKVGNADLGTVANGVTTIMVDYAKSHVTAAQATNILVATVAAGKTHMQDLATAMSTILPTSSAVGVGLKDTSAALATMTGEGTNAAAAATYLRQLLMALEAPASKGAKALAEIGLTTADVSNEMKISLPATLEMITDHLKKKFPEGSAAYVEALKNIAGGSRQMQGILELTGTHLQVFKNNLTDISGAAKSGGDAITGWNLVQQDFNFKLSQAREVVETLGIKLGTLLLPIATQAISLFLRFGDVFTYFRNIFRSLNLSDFSDAWKAVSIEVGYVMSRFSQLGAVFGQIGTDADPIANVIGSLMKSGLQTVTNLLWNVSAAFIAIDRTVQSGGASGGIKALGSTFQQLSEVVGGVFTHHMQTMSAILADVSKWFSSVLMPAVRQALPGFESLGKTLITTVVPALVQLWVTGQGLIDRVLPPLVKVIEAAIPFFVTLAGVIASGLSVAIKFLTPYILEAAKAIATFAGDIATRVAPILVNWFKMLSDGLNNALAIWRVIWPIFAPILKGVFDEIIGVVQIAWALISGIFKVALDLLSGNWKQAWTDMGDMLGGIWAGVIQTIKGAINIVIGLIDGFISGINSIGVDIGPVHIHPNIPKIPQLALGTDFFGGGDALVGERGPELVRLPRGAQVVPNNRLGSVGANNSSASSGQPVVLMMDGRVMARGLMPHITNEIRYNTIMTGA